MAEDFDVMEVCYETVVTCVEPEVCSCLVSGFIFVVFPCGFDVSPLCLAGWGNGFLGEFFLCFFFIILLIVSKLGGVCFEGWCLFLPIGQLFRFRVYLHARGPTERLLSCPICWGVVLFFLLLLLFELSTQTKDSFIHSFIPLACAESNDSLSFSGASSIPLCYILFPATLLHQLFFHPPSLHLAIYFLVYLSICNLETIITIHTKTENTQWQGMHKSQATGHHGN